MDTAWASLLTGAKLSEWESEGGGLEVKGFLESGMSRSIFGSIIMTYFFSPALWANYARESAGKSWDRSCFSLQHSSMKSSWWTGSNHRNAEMPRWRVWTNERVNDQNRELRSVLHVDSYCSAWFEEIVPCMWRFAWKWLNPGQKAGLLSWVPPRPKAPGRTFEKFRLSPPVDLGPPHLNQPLTSDP